jgi:tetratricopeptide (TPR) repeat protein
VELEAGSVDAAAERYESARQTIEALLEADPDNRMLADTLAESFSWLGSVREQQGRLEASEQSFEKAAAGFERIHRRYPDDRNFEERWERELGQVCRMQRIRGRMDEARAVCRQVRDGTQALVAYDPENRTWRRTYGYALLAYGDALLMSGLPDEARPEIRAGLDEFTSLVADDPNVADWRIMHAASHRLTAELELVEGNLAEASAAAGRAAQVLDDAELDSGRRVLLERARIHLVSGKTAERSGRPDAAALAWAAGLDALQVAQGDYPDAIEMSLRAELLSLLGQCEESGPIVIRLAEMGAATPETGCGGIEEEIAGT